MNQIDLNQINSDLKKICPEKDQYYFGHGKLLLTGEYCVLEGALSLALPTKVGQSLSVKYSPSFSPTLTWKSYDVDGKLWFEEQFEFWHFKSLNKKPSDESLFLQKILLQVRKQNSHFLRDNVDVVVETKLGFPITWGLGSSSTLIYNIAQWAYVSPFELLFNTTGGSGYDIACAQSDGPILYKKIIKAPNWSPVYFNPSFRKNLYFIYLGKKQNSRKEVEKFSQKKVDPQIISQVTSLTQEFLMAQTLKQFQSAMNSHENIISNLLGVPTIKESQFPDFPGALKSLGAWGGDFIMAATPFDFEYVKKYFSNANLQTIYKYDDLFSEPVEMDHKDFQKMDFSNHLLH